MTHKGVKIFGTESGKPLGDTFGLVGFTQGTASLINQEYFLCFGRKI